MLKIKLHHFFLVAILTIAQYSSGADDVVQIRESLKGLHSCVVESTFSYLFPEAFLPVNVQQLKQTCQRQSESFKCLKEKSKTTPALIKRGLAAYTLSRSRHHRTICANPNSNSSRSFLDAAKCIVDKKFKQHAENDAIFANKLIEIKQKNLTDSALELKYICCSLVTYRKNMLELFHPECSAYKSVIEPLVYSIVTNDMDLVCEDEEKLLHKTCPKLSQPLKENKSFKLESSNSPAVLTLYLFATLGLAD